MKKHISIYTLTLVVILGISAFTNTANAQTSEDLVGTWNMDFNKMKNSTNIAPGIDYNKLPSDSKANIKEAFESRTFTFNANQTVTVSFAVRGNNKQASGSWTYETSNKLLTIQIGGETKEYYTTFQGKTMQMEPLTLEANAVFKSLSLTKK